MKELLFILKPLNSVLLVPFCLGVWIALSAYHKNKQDPKNLIMVLLPIIFIVPFISYYIIGRFLHKFGENRNFFYLLPIYILLVFYGLKRIIVDKKAFYSISCIIAALFIASGIAMYYPQLRDFYNARYMLQESGKAESAVVVIATPYGGMSFDFQHYKNKFNAPERTYLWTKSNEPIQSIYGLIRDEQSFVLIEDTTSTDKSKNLSALGFKEISARTLSGFYGPFSAIQKLTRQASKISIKTYKR